MSYTTTTTTTTTSTYYPPTVPVRPRTSTSQNPPPPLQRDTDRRASFVDNLVDSAALIIETIWSTNTASPHIHPIDPKTVNKQHPCGLVLPLRTFIQETLRRSRTSYSTLQLALWYLILLRDRCDEQKVHGGADGQLPPCGRRSFLSALILASKFLQDRNYSNRAWSRISGLSTSEINANEMEFLKRVSWTLFVSVETFGIWASVLAERTGGVVGRDSWAGRIKRDGVDVKPLSPAELVMEAATAYEIQKRRMRVEAEIGLPTPPSSQDDVWSYIQMENHDEQQQQEEEKKNEGGAVDKGNGLLTPTLTSTSSSPSSRSDSEMLLQQKHTEGVPLSPWSLPSRKRAASDVSEETGDDLSKRVRITLA
ncbi:PHO85 cyclin-5 [Saitoella coloradoensis]